MTLAPDSRTRDLDGDDLARERVAFDVRDDDFRLFRAACLMARVAGHEPDVDAVERQVRALAQRVRGRLHDDASWSMQLASLLEVLFVEEGFAGEFDDYDAPENSFLDVVLERHRGLPIALSLVTVEVAQQAGIDAYGIGFPGHFVVGFPTEIDGKPEVVVVDPFHKGRLLGPTELEAQLRALGSADALDASHLAPSTSSAILQRMLNNLRSSYARRQDAACLARVLSRQLLFQPSSALLHLERGQLRHELLDDDGAHSDASTALALAGSGPQAAAARALLHMLAQHARFLN